MVILVIIVVVTVIFSVMLTSDYSGTGSKWQL